MRHLWQRIFTYSILLILLSQLGMFLWYKYSQDTEGLRRFITENVIAIAGAMEGQSLETAKAIAAPYNRRNGRVWLEDAAGAVIAGKADPEQLEQRKEAGADPVWESESLKIWQYGKDSDQYLAFLPLHLRGTDASLLMAFGPPRQHTPLWAHFMKGGLALCLISVILALWMARRVSRPLRKLRAEVLEIAGGDLEQRVSAGGRDEITDVAMAVNQMADNLARHIRGMRELVANISHELRSPLARMRVSLALLEENLTPPESGPPLPEKSPAGTSGSANPEKGKRDMQKALAKIGLLQEELAHMDKLIGTTLLSSKLDLQDRPKLENMVSFSDLCLEMCRRQEPLFRSEALDFTYNIEAGIAFPGVETLLCTLVSNLLDNAAKYTEKGGQVTLRLYKKDNAAKLEVENTHEALAAEKLEHIFEPFNRIGLATGNGVGLGLHLTRQIISVHKGYIRAGNSAGGICFYASLPLSQE